MAKYNENDIQKKLNKKRKAFRDFDRLPIAEQRRLRDQGLDPHEPEHIRKAKQKKVKDEVRARLNKSLSRYTKEKRESIIAALGLAEDTEPDHIHTAVRIDS